MRIALLGPIAAWWDEWDSPRHQRYVAWRDRIRRELVDAGHLVYSPHRAWQGNWDENDGDASAQIVNDAAINTCDAVINLTPAGVASPGTEHEMDLCLSSNKLILFAPPSGPDDSVDDVSDDGLIYVVLNALDVISTGSAHWRGA